MSNQTVTVSIDCTTSNVTVTAPADYSYRLTLTTLQVTQNQTSSQSVTTGPHTGNHTVPLASPSTVYAFVQNQSAGETVAVATAACESDTTTQDDPADPVNVTVNCTTGQIHLVPAEQNYEYGVAIATVSVTETTTQTRRKSVTPLTGNTTIDVTTDAAVYVFVTNTSGEVVATARTPCLPSNATDARAGPQS